MISQQPKTGRDDEVHRPTSSRHRWIAAVLAVVLGGWLVFDGTRALVIGDYLTPSTGPHAGELGPWAKLVAAVGIEPRSTMVKALHVGLGLAWLVTAICLMARRPQASRALLGCALASLWYLPFGTLISVIEISLLLKVRSQLVADV